MLRFLLLPALLLGGVLSGNAKEKQFPLAEASPEKRFPADAVINVTLPPYNARPEPGVDNTEALQRAITENVETGRVLYFPSGTYRISKPLMAKNRDGYYRAHLTVQGQGRDLTCLQLVDGAAGFGDETKPQAMILTGSLQEKGDSTGGGGNKAFRNNVFDLTLDTGKGNPGAIGIEYAVSNQGTIQHVTIRSGDGKGVAGIALLRPIPGPGLIKDVNIVGFDFGIDIGDRLSGMTLENIRLEAQRKAGIRVGENVLSIRHLMSVNRVPAILVTKTNGMVLLTESLLSGGTEEHVAIDCSGNLFLRDVTTAGYRAAAVKCQGRDVPGPQYSQFAWPTAKGSDGLSTSTELLRVEQTPEYWNNDLTDWMAVGPRKEGEPDDTAAIQRAFDSGKGTIYFPNTKVYFLSDTVVVRGKVRQVLGLGSEISLGAAKEPFSDRAHPRPLIRIDPTEAGTVFFEGMMFNAQYPGEVIFENNTPATVVIKQGLGWVGAEGQRRTYRNTKQGTGKLFLEDNFLPGWDFTGQQVWARQFNPENFDGDGSVPQVTNDGGKLWILGFKTEGPAPFIATKSGGTTELLGAYNYASALAAKQVPVKSVPYLVSDATAALTFVSDNFREKDYEVYIRKTQRFYFEAQGDVVLDFKASDLWQRDGHPGLKCLVVPLWRSEVKP